LIGIRGAPMVQFHLYARLCHGDGSIAPSRPKEHRNNPQPGEVADRDAVDSGVPVAFRSGQANGPAMVQ